jgi:putative glutamine amidotransferase
MTRASDREVLTMTRRPAIGIPAVFTTAQWGFWHDHAHLVADTYVSAVWESGGLPIIIPPLGEGDEDTLDQVLSQVDALLLIGGADLDPAEYRQAPHDLLEETSHVRDRFELPLIRRALHRDVPMLGICRGLQAMNVAVGGSLHQDLLHEGFSDHRPAPGHLDHTTFHETAVEAGTTLASIIGTDKVQTNSHHHQGVAEVAEGATVAAWATSDGCVEALEWREKRFAVGVQWHPEKPRMAEFFAALVDAARQPSLHA